MRHFIFIEQIEDEAPFPYFVGAETLEKAIRLFAEAFIDPDEARDDLEAQDIDPSCYSEEQLLIKGLQNYIDYITAYEIKSDFPGTPDCWMSFRITDFQEALHQLI